MRKDKKVALTGFMIMAGLCFLKFSDAAAVDSVSQSPLSVYSSVPPNLILTLDDSGSMRMGFVPDRLKSLTVVRVSRRAKSAYYNPMYYNPGLTYEVPVRIDKFGGVSDDEYKTSFFNAPNNGFRQGSDAVGSVDLSKKYKVAWSYRLGSNEGDTYAIPTGIENGSVLAENPSADFAPISENVEPILIPSLRVGSTTTSPQYILLQKAGSLPEDVNKIAFKIKRTGSFSCEVEFGIYNNDSIPRCRMSEGGGYYISTKAKDRRQSGVPAYYYVYDESVMDCSTLPVAIRRSDDRCYRLINVSSTSGVERADDPASGRDERKNFAIWYSFYRNRGLATLSGANLAFKDLPTSTRLTWQTLSLCKTFNSDAPECGGNYLGSFSGVRRGNFFKWLERMSFDISGTPLLEAMKRVGEYLKTDEPWAYEPNPYRPDGARGSTVKTPEYACRPSYQIMMTDGAWTTNLSGPFPVNSDDVSVSLPDGKLYSPRPPFFGKTTKSLADLAFNYWSTDARPGLPNKLKSSSSAASDYWNPRYDPATWQHLVTFPIGVGLTASLEQGDLPWGGSTYAGAGYEALAEGKTGWPAVGPSDPNNVYDLWHTAINSRGQFFSADSPNAIKEAFSKIIDLIGDAPADSVTPPVVKSTDIGLEAYGSRFKSDDWSGDLIKEVNGSLSSGWSANDRLGATLPAGRNIEIASESGPTKLQPFMWSNLSDIQKAMLNKNPDAEGEKDALGPLRVDFLRGNRDNEGTIDGKFRVRGGVLGDIVNSSPLLVQPPRYWAAFADSIEGDGSNYAAFRQEQAARRNIVYVGANDGMLHGFDAGSGSETFAFIPSAVFKNLYRLTGRNYKGNQHRFYVDATPVSTDVYFDGNWHTVLVGTLGGGGRSIFALDITNPDKIRLLWERQFDGGDSTLKYLGYTFPRPYVARLYNGSWAVVTGNGYSGTADGKAALMLFDVKTGRVLKALEVTGDATRPNGLSGVYVTDFNNDGVAEYAYAGDLQGNLWRFDLFPTRINNISTDDPFRRGQDGVTDSAAYVDEFAVSYDGHPLFTARDNQSGAPQPITAPPVLVRHPSGLGYVVIFGTGKYFESNDIGGDVKRSMSLYGIWDRRTKGQATSAPPVITRQNLTAQQFKSLGAGNRTISRNAVTWYSHASTGTEETDVDKRGWVLDLSIESLYEGEMLVSPMTVRGSTLLAWPLVPGSNICEGQVKSLRLGIDPYTGGAPRYNVFDVNGDGTIDTADETPDGQVVVAYEGKGGLGGAAIHGGWAFPCVGGNCVPEQYSAGPSFVGRQSWRAYPEESSR